MEKKIVATEDAVPAEVVVPTEPEIAVIVVEGTEILQQTETIIIFKVTRPLMAHEYEELSARVRAENQASGLKIVLAPCIVDGVEISG